jgi:hypothetical protein
VCGLQVRGVVAAIVRPRDDVVCDRWIVCGERLATQRAAGRVRLDQARRVEVGAGAGSLLRVRGAAVRARQRNRATDRARSKDEFPDGPPTAVVTHRGYKLVLRFAEGDFFGEGRVQELRLLPDVEPLEPRILRRFALHAEEYVAYARAAMRIYGPEGTVEERWANLRGVVDALRQVGRPGRGLTDSFYRQIARNYDALVSEGEPHPIKALGEIHHVTISAASRWVKGARDRGFLHA